MLSGNFYGLEVRQLDFLGVIFWSKDFLGFVWSPRDFFGFWFLPPFDHCCHLKSGVPPSPLGFCDLVLFKSDRVFEAISQSVVSAYFDSTSELWTKKLVSTGGHMRPFLQNDFWVSVTGGVIFFHQFCFLTEVFLLCSLSVYLSDWPFVCVFPCYNRFHNSP